MKLSYKNLKRVLGRSMGLHGVNESGEDIVVMNGRDCVFVDTYQNNGWVRTDAYYSDGMIETCDFVRLEQRA